MASYDSSEIGFAISTAFNIPLTHYETPGRNARLEAVMGQFLIDHPKKFSWMIHHIEAIHDHKGFLEIMTGKLTDLDERLVILKTFGCLWSEQGEDHSAVVLYVGGCSFDLNHDGTDLIDSTSYWLKFREGIRYEL